MEATFGRRLQSARKQAGYRTQEQLGDRIGVSAKSVRNWEGDKHRPDVATIQKLRDLLGEFDAEGEPVEVAIRQSELTVDRQYTVIGFYQRQLREQHEGRTA